MRFILADEESSAVVKKERMFKLQNPMKQATSLRALKRRHTKSESDSSSDDAGKAVTSTYKSKRYDVLMAQMTVGDFLASVNTETREGGIPPSLLRLSPVQFTLIWSCSLSTDKGLIG